MKCSEHPQNDSIGKCTDCGKEICSLCLTALADKVYCPSCIDKLISQNAEDEETVDLNKATRKKITGIILLTIGIVGFVSSIGVMFVGCSSMTNMDDPEHMSIVFIGFCILMVTFLILIVGTILFSVGKSEVKKAQNQNIPQDLRIGNGGRTRDLD